MRRILSSLAMLLFMVQFASAQELTTARQVIDGNLEATGGKAAWEAVTDVHNQATVTVDMAMGVISIAMDFHATSDGHVYGLIELKDGPDAVPAEAVRQEVYMTPDGGWVKTAQGQQDINDMPEAAQMGLRNQFAAKPELMFAALPDSALALDGTREFNGGTAYVVKITMAGQETTYLYDTETLYLVGQETTTPMGAVTMVSSDFRDVGNGLMIAYNMSGDMGAAGSQTVTIDAFEINKGTTRNDIQRMSQPKVSIE